MRRHYKGLTKIPIIDFFHPLVIYDRLEVKELLLMGPWSEYFVSVDQIICIVKQTALSGDGTILYTYIIYRTQCRIEILSRGVTKHPGREGGII